MTTQQITRVEKRLRTRLERHMPPELTIVKGGNGTTRPSRRSTVGESEAVPPRTKALRSAYFDAMDDAEAFFDAAPTYVKHLEGRVAGLISQLKTLLASGLLKQTARADALAAMFGGTNRDANLLSEIEARLIADYRVMEQADRTKLRGYADLAARAARTGKGDER